MKNRAGIFALLFLQVACTVFFVYDLLITILGLPVTPIDWQVFELIEIGAAIGLIIGVVFIALALRRSLREAERVRSRLRVASGAFMDLLEESFDDWGLTPAERDVALFAIKGLSTREIAGLRASSEGTVRAQTNAIYRKAGVASRPQLLSLFIEDLMHDDIRFAPPDRPADRDADAAHPPCNDRNATQA